MAWTARNLMINYLRKQLTFQPLAVPGSGGGKTASGGSTPTYYIYGF